jgi:L-cystine uptake protein TcyP (sodium:dicarboxylate symporter family)
VPADTSRADWTSPDYVATVVGVLAVGALGVVAALTRSGPTVDDVTFVVSSITVPVTLAYELARRRR